MTFASVWALAGLLALVPLVALHLRARGHPIRQVPSLLLWRQLEELPSPGDTGRRLPPLSVLLFLQIAAVAFLVIALAQPRADGGARAASKVVVIDDSLWMSPPGRLIAAKRSALRFIHAVPSGGTVAIVAAGATPSTIYRGPAARASAALRSIRPTAAPANLAAALVTASGLLAGKRDQIDVIHAPEDRLPATTAAGGELRSAAIGSPIADQGIFDASARCGIGSPRICEVYAEVVNHSSRVVDDRYTAQAAGRQSLAGQVKLAAHANAKIALLASPGAHVTLSLTERDGIQADNAAAVTVPGQGGGAGVTNVTLVGARAQALPLAQALVADPGVRLRIAKPAAYRASAAKRAGVLVFDGTLPRGGWPAAPAVLLVNPPHIPGGRVGASLTDARVSGTDDTSSLLKGVDLSSLDIDRGAAHGLSLPDWITPVVWSPDGPLIAAGDDGHQRVAVLAFNPAQSNLPQLSGFPVLVANLVAWASQWAPPSATTGAPILVDATPGARTVSLSLAGKVIERVRLGDTPASLLAPKPGFYSVTEHGQGVDRTTTIAASTATPATAGGTPVDLLSSRTGARTSPATPLDDWFVTAALVAVTLEALYWTARRRRMLA